MIKIVSALIIGLLPSLAMADCIDESNISDDFSCIEIWNPVCGCDGITYSNDCFAENAGVTNWADGECQQQDETLIEGRWVTQFEGNTINTMYEFLDGFRYTYYCNDSNNDCDSTYWNSLDTSDALPTINPYTVYDSTLSIDLHFGTIATYTIGFRCDGQQVDFYYDEDDWVEGLHSSMARVGFDYVDSECQQQDETLIEGRWLWNYGGFAYSASTMYEFLDGFRYTYYCNDSNNDCDSTYWNSLDTSDAIPNPDSYTFKNDTLTIQESRLINFECDGDIFLFGDNTFSYYWRVDLDTSSCENQIVTQQLTLSENIKNPEKFGLNQNYPNPFNPLTSLSYDLLEDSYVSVTIYDMLGNVINNLVSANQSSGFNSVQWDATNNHGQPVAAGIYLYSIEVGDARQTKKMILLK